MSFGGPFHFTGVCCYLTGNKSDETGLMARLFLQVTQIQFSAHTCWLRSICNLISRGSDARF